MTQCKILLWIVFFSMILPLSSYAQSPIHLYWTEFRTGDSERSRILRANIDGSGVETLIDGLQTSTGPKGLAVDSGNRKLYFANRGESKIERANLDGSGRETLIESIHPYGIALDLLHGKIYWGDYTYSDPKIMRANLDGTGAEDLVYLSDGCQLEGIALDVSGGKVYWVERMDDEIWRANFDGTLPQRILVCYEGVGNAFGVAVGGGKLYWSDASGDEIERSDLDGDNVEKAVTGLTDHPRLIAIDMSGMKLYWATGDAYGHGMIQRANLDGSGLETLVTGLYSAYGIALGYDQGHPGHGGVCIPCMELLLGD